MIDHKVNWREELPLKDLYYRFIRDFTEDITSQLIIGEVVRVVGVVYDRYENWYAVALLTPQGLRKTLRLPYAAWRAARESNWWFEHFEEVDPQPE